MIDTARVEILTDASGDFTATTVSLNGKLHGFAIKLDDAAAVDVVIDNADGLNLFTKTGLTDGFFLSRFKTVSELNVDITYDGTRKVFDVLPVNGELAITIANGGDAKKAALILYLEK